LLAPEGAGRKALIPYVTAGDPFADVTPDADAGAGAGGADIIELGVPFSDPMADGPVIQKAGERRWRAASAWTAGAGPWCGSSARRHRTPVVLMGYANPVERYDQRHGAKACAFVRRCGARPAWTACWWWTTRPKNARPSPRSCGAGLDLIFLLAPTSTDERMAQVGRIASGYVYYVSLKGVTGAGTWTPTPWRHVAAHPAACQRAGRCGLRHPRRATARAVAAWPTRW
jgi:tryptophan synthase alpha chain